MPDHYHRRVKQPLSRPHAMKNVPSHQVALIVVALATWVFLYGGGLLMESVEYRAVLSPHTMEKHLKVADPTLDVKEIQKSRNAALSFAGAILWFSPTNLALLTLVAAFLGGTVSNLVVSSLEEHEKKSIHGRRLAFLSEHPLAATMRGFVIYLCVIAGLYVAMDDPFKESSSGQYARLAGTLSLIAFVVGYDPSRVEYWLRLVPTPAQRSTNVETEVRRQSTTKLIQEEAITRSAPALSSAIPERGQELDPTTETPSASSALKLSNSDSDRGKRAPSKPGRPR